MVKIQWKMFSVSNGGKFPAEKIQLKNQTDNFSWLGKTETIKSGKISN
jgi:hypothetical protein